MRILERISNWRSIGGLLFLYLIFAIVILPTSMDMNPPHMGPLDLLFSYSPKVAYAHLESFGATGRERYIKVSTVIDTIYPVIYTLLFLTLINRLQKGGGLSSIRSQYIQWVPLLAFVFDLMENACIVFMLSEFPERHDGMAELSSLFTSLKWISVGLSFAAIGALLFIKLRVRLNR